MGRFGRLALVSSEDIAHRLRRGRRNRAARWETDKERWSLGGQQAKFVLRREGQEWFSCEGAAATTHILKPGIAELKLSALNEYICLKLARACGLSACEVDYLVFDEEPAIVTTRYDRLRDDEDRVRRLHQEDFCQVLGVLPSQKYPEDGGPGARDIVEVCKRTGAPAADNIARYTDMLFFNYLIGAPDAHAKNYSLLLGRADAYLAPLYDVASLLPYAERPFDIKLAQGIAGENRMGRLSARRLAKFSDACGLGEFGLTGDVLAERHYCAAPFLLQREELAQLDAEGALGEQEAEGGVEHDARHESYEQSGHAEGGRDYGRGGQQHHGRGHERPVHGAAHAVPGAHGKGRGRRLSLQRPGAQGAPVQLARVVDAAEIAVPHDFLPTRP